MMSTSSNKAVVERLVDEVFNAGDLHAVNDLLSPQFLDHNAAPDSPGGIPGYQGFVAMLHAAFSDFHFALDDLIAENDKVVIRGTIHGTNEGELMGMPATGREATWTATHTFRLADGRIAEHWGNIDLLGLMRQLGHIPT